MVNERQYPHNHGDLVMVGGKEVIFGDGFEYVRGDVLVASEDVEVAISRIGRWYGKRGRVEQGDSSGRIASIEVPQAVDPLVVVERLKAAGIAASPNHVLKATWHGTFIGTGQPKPARPSRWLNGQLKKASAQKGGPVVAVIDTGMVDHPNLPNVSGVGPSVDQLTDPASKVFGHGTFVAGLITSECPEADIRMLRVDFGSRSDNWFGLVTDLALSKTIELALTKLSRIDVLNLSFGGYTHDGQSLIATNASVAKAVRLGVTVVAGAGNDGRRGDPFYPAAEPGVIAVGSTDAKGRLSCFSNVGPWVDVIAVGEDVLSTFPIAEVHCMALPESESTACGPSPAVPEQTVDFNTGFARWSGTSFAAARVSGGIARTRIGR
jgi:hypothetical protein